MEDNKEVAEVKKVDNEEKTTETKEKKGFCIASMVLGIVSLVFCYIWIISIPCSILAIVFGILGIKAKQKGMAIAGLITAAIGIMISFVIFMALFTFGMITGIRETIDETRNRYDDYSDYDYDYDYNDYTF